jgi:hypothetical protein
MNLLPALASQRMGAAPFTQRAIDRLATCPTMKSLKNLEPTIIVKE